MGNQRNRRGDANVLAAETRGADGFRFSLNITRRVHPLQKRVEAVYHPNQSIEMVQHPHFFKQVQRERVERSRSASYAKRSHFHAVA